MDLNDDYVASSLRRRVDNLEGTSAQHSDALAELRTIKKISGFVAAILLAQCAGWAISAVRASTQLEALAKAAEQHEALPSHRGGIEANASIRADLRVISMQVEATIARSEAIERAVSRLSQARSVR